MAVIAVAGGTGYLGRTIVKELVIQAKHEVIILSRKRPVGVQYLAPVVEVDYSDVGHLKKVLEENQVHTVISAIMILKDKAASDMQVNLIKAAGNSAVTKRFMPSEFSIDNQPSIVELAPNVQWFLDAVDALKETDLEYARLLIGYFIDYYGMPQIETHLSPFKYALDIENKEAIISGNGDEPISMIYSIDFAKFVVAALDLEKWEETYAVIGETTTFNKMLHKAEEILGKFDVSYESKESLERGTVRLLSRALADTPTEEELLKAYYRFYGLMNIQGLSDISGYPTLNSEFPYIKALSATEFLEKAWGRGRQQDVVN